MLCVLVEDLFKFLTQMLDVFMILLGYPMKR